MCLDNEIVAGCSPAWQLYVLFFWTSQRAARSVSHNITQRWFGTPLLTRLPEHCAARVIMAADKTGYPHSASGHRDDSSLCSTLRWWRLRDDDGRRAAVAPGRLQPVDAGDRHYSSPLSSPPHSSLSVTLPLAPPLPPIRHAPRERAQRQIRISICFHGYRGAAAKTAAKPFQSRHCAWETMVLRPTPPSSSLPLHTTPLSRVSWQMLVGACTYTQNTLCPHVMAFLKDLLLCWFRTPTFVCFFQWRIKNWEVLTLRRNCKVIALYVSWLCRDGQLILCFNYQRIYSISLSSRLLITVKIKHKGQLKLLLIRWEQGLRWLADYFSIPGAR